MATFSVEIADQDVNRVIEALCVNYNRPEQLYVFEQDDGTGIFMGEHLDYITVEFIDKLN